MSDYRKDLCRLILTLGIILTIAWAPYLFFGKTLLASASDVPSIYPTGAQPLRDSGARFYRSLDPGAPGWQNEPWLAVEHRLIFDDHVLPLWNPYDAYGAPFAASMIAQPFYPPAFLASIAPTPWTYNLLVIGRLFLLAVGCAAFVRLFTGFAPALVAGICAAFSGYFIIYVDIVHVGVEVMLPWLLIGTEIIIRRQYTRNAALLAAAWGVSLLGGMPESSALASIVVGLYALCRIFLERHDQKTFTRVISLCSGIAAGTAIAGVMLIPFIEYLRRDFDVHQSGVPGLGFQHFLPRLLLTEFAPLAFGPPVNSILPGVNGLSGFIGGPGMLGGFFASLAAVTAVGARRRTRTDWVALFLFLTAVGFEAKRFGFSALQWIGALPFLRLTLFTKYGEAEVAICIACAAGFGVAAVLERKVGFWQLWATLSLVLGVFTWLYNGTILPAGTLHVGYFYLAIALSLFTFALSGIIVASASGTVALNPITYAIIALTLFESAFALFVPIYYIVDKPPSDSRDPYIGASYVTYLQRATTKNDSRIVATSGMLYPDWSGAFGLYDTRGLSAMYPERYLKFIHAFVGTEQPSSDNESDRFTGSKTINFDNPLVQRWMTLSSIGYIISSTALPPKPGPTTFLYDLWIQNKGFIASANLTGVSTTVSTIDGITENVLFDHPPNSAIAYDTEVPSNDPWLGVDLALDPAVWNIHCGGAVTFTINVRDAEGRLIANTVKTIDPKHVPADRHWNRLTLDLRRVRGRAVTLRFGTAAFPRENLCSASAEWGEPRWMPSFEAQPYRNTRHDGFSLVSTSRNADIYRVDAPLGRLTLVHGVRPAANEDDALRVIAQTPFDPKRSVVIEGILPIATGSGQGDSITLVDRTSQRVEAEVTTSSDAVLLQNDTWYPGWHATVDGQESTILRADFLFRAIAIPPGRHRVVIEYRSVSAAIGLALTVTGLLAFGLMLWLPRALFWPGMRKHSNAAR